MTGAPIFVHAEPGRWGLMPLDGDLPLPVDVQDVVAALSSMPHDPVLAAGTPSERDAGRALSPTCSVGPGGPVIGVLGAGRLIVETHDGRRVSLDADDLRLFDSVRSPMLLGSAGDDGEVPMDPEELRRRAAGLVTAGLLVVHEAESPR